MAAAGANVRVYCHMIAVQRDRAGRTEIEAAAATDNPRSRMRAELFAGDDEPPKDPFALIDQVRGAI